MDHRPTSWLGVAWLATVLMSSAAHAALLRSDIGLNADSAASSLSGQLNSQSLQWSLTHGASTGPSELPFHETWSLQSSAPGTWGGAEKLLPPTVVPRAILLGGSPRDFEGLDVERQCDPPSPVPLPAGLWLLASGTLGIWPLLRRRPALRDEQRFEAGASTK